MRQEISRLIHDIDPVFAVGNSDVHVQPEDETSPGDLLHVVNGDSIAVVRRDLLVHPMREWMSAGRSDHPSITSRDRGQLAAKADNLLPRAVNVAANLRAKLDH